MNPISPVHWSNQNGLHVDHMMDGYKIGHEPIFPGQTTLNTFIEPSYMNDRQMYQINNPGMPAPMLPYQQFGPG